MGGRGGSSGSKGIGGVGLDVTYNGETTRYYFERHGNQNYYSTGMGGMAEPTPQNMTPAEFKRRVESNGAKTAQVILMTDEKKDRQSFYNSETIQVTGVLISAEGGGNPVVVQNIQEAVMALFQVDAHRIRIMKMK